MINPYKNDGYRGIDGSGSITDGVVNVGVDTVDIIGTDVYLGVEVY